MAQLKGIVFAAAAGMLIVLSFTWHQKKIEYREPSVSEMAQKPRTSVSHVSDSPNGGAQPISSPKAQLPSELVSSLPAVASLLPNGTPGSVASQELGIKTAEQIGHDAQNLSPIGIESTDPKSVIGRPFPLSASVEKACKDLGRLCIEHFELLEKFAQEPRDLAWAPKVEAKLRNFVMTREGGPFLIRAVECRTSVCALEAASNYGLMPAIFYGHPVNHDLRELEADTGHEVDSKGTPITVTFLLAQRR